MTHVEWHNRMSDRMPDSMPERTPEDLAERVPDKIPEKIYRFVGLGPPERNYFFGVRFAAKFPERLSQIDQAFLISTA